MTYLALYRAWRPQAFKDVTGQKHVTRTLQNALRQKKFAHAYLFSGPRGIGKTSIAKIFAKAINCQEGQPEEPCNTCTACKAITSGELLDVSEIDAASNRGVDEIRDLRDQVKYAPTEVPYKVYIIDEVHMLTNEAFNALLKTLEEPPSHVIFILATTEPHKLPLTIISRCQRFDFQRISNDDIVQRLQYICDETEVGYEQEAFEVIAYSSEGGLRDALSLLDQSLALGNNALKLEHVQTITGSMNQKLLISILEHIANRQINDALIVYDEAIAEGKDPKQVVKDLLHFCRDLLLLKVTPTIEEIKHKGIMSDENQQLAERFTDEELIDMLEQIARTDNEARFINQPRVLVELMIVRLCRRANVASETVAQKQDGSLNNQYIQQIQQLQQQFSDLQESIKQGTFTVGNDSIGAESSNKSIAKPKITKTAIPMEQLEEIYSQNNHKVLSKIQANWNDVLERVKRQKVTLHAWLINGEPVAVYQQYIVLAFKNAIHRETTDQLENRQLIEGVIKAMTSKPFQVMTLLANDWEQAAKSVSGEGGTANEQDELVNKAIELFGEEFVEIKE
ncbi:DNA polymerase III subunit gamma/tau [Desulfuribacillus alkaliarsenatis]|uniref:DNA-directed DNA polymerase n=1 Tax=Desulfuribacillus alkaliarsenatis TaxID=766136 RepID=A0A1E5FYR7_9FIRM|nr:DNA polymerase III subunit gamma/tau [Desulfuribacillus alkaliarsenatis]OEF95725.1 hypothetical protein BHF68_11540 [Desulfuribacillus alkaliarsenatis]